MGTFREEEQKNIEPPENHWTQDLGEVWQEEDADLTAEQQAEILEAWLWSI